MRQYRCLYDKGCPEFKDKNKKENAWTAIANELHITVKKAEDRYKNVRTVFGRYLKGLKPPSGSGRDSIVIKPEFEHLRWLITHIDHRKTTTNINAPTCTSDEPPASAAEG